MADMQQSFGGKWTEDKLQIVQKYLEAYLSIMRRNENASRYFEISYLDGFAGSGEGYQSSSGLFEEFIDPETQEFYKGSVHRALEAKYHFDHYLFLDSNETYLDRLQTTIDLFPERAKLCEKHAVDVNQFIPGWIDKMKHNHRALVFLDPYGMQVEWKTLEYLAKSEKTDVWLLMPLGQGVKRMLTNQEPPEKWSARLTKFFGDESWRSEFYKVEAVDTLFGPEDLIQRDASFDGIKDYFVRRLKQIFVGVLEEPAILRNSKDFPLYMLCFAASHPKGAPTALRIAKDISRKIQNGR